MGQVLVEGGLFQAWKVGQPVFGDGMLDSRHHGGAEGGMTVGNKICSGVTWCGGGQLCGRLGRFQRDVPKIVGGSGAGASEDDISGWNWDGFSGDGDFVFGEDGSAIGITELANGNQVGVSESWDDINLGGCRWQLRDGQVAGVGRGHGALVSTEDMDGCWCGFLVGNGLAGRGKEVAGGSCVRYIEGAPFVGWHIKGCGCGCWWRCS